MSSIHQPNQNIRQIEEVIKRYDALTEQLGQYDKALEAVTRYVQEPEEHVQDMSVATPVPIPAKDRVVHVHIPDRGRFTVSAGAALMVFEKLHDEVLTERARLIVKLQDMGNILRLHQEENDENVDPS
jgi:prefoldin subunit 5